MRNKKIEKAMYLILALSVDSVEALITERHSDLLVALERLKKMESNNPNNYKLHLVLVLE